MDYNSFIGKFEKIQVKHHLHRVTDKPKVSVCVQTYQHREYIGQCLDGILNQKTDFDYEILLGEDASDDGTREICINYAERNPGKIRLFLHHRENNIKINDKPTGRYNFTYNLFEARGQYIALCEGDDYWVDPLKIQRQVDFLETHPDFSLCGHWSKKLEHDKLNGSILGHFEKSEFDFIDIASANIRIPTSSLVFRNHLILPDWFISTYGADMAIIFLNAQQGKIKVLNFVGSVYRVHEGGLEQHYKKDKLAKPLRNIREYSLYRDILDRPLKNKWERRIAWNYLYLSLIQFKSIQVLEALRSLFFSLWFKICSLR